MEPINKMHRDLETVVDDVLNLVAWERTFDAHNGRCGDTVEKTLWELHNAVMDYAYKVIRNDG